MRRVSVVCPVFNTEPAMLRAAVRSVLAQEGSGLAEILLVDDCSTDAGTRQELACLEGADPRVRILRNASNLGPGGSRNAGVRAASGTWIGFLDADDLWPAGSLAARLAAPAGEDDCVLAAFEELVEGGKTRDAVPLPLEEGGESLGRGWVAWSRPHSTHGVIALWRHIGGVLAPKAMLEKAGLFDEGLRYGEDWLLLVRLTLACRQVVATNAPLYVLRRQHVSMMSRRALLTRAFSRAQEKAYSDPALRPYRKHLRWALVRQYKGMAVNSLANDAPWNGLRCALRAYSLDPRELGPLVTFLRAAMTRDQRRKTEVARRYSKAVVTEGLA